jgi:cell division septum initiation protein DivIVA
MSHEGLKALATDLAIDRTFRVTLRGYRRAEVDNYVRFLEWHVSELTQERQGLLDERTTLLTQLATVHAELLTRRLPAAHERITVSHLGQRAGLLLSLADEEARSVRQHAAAQADARRQEALDEANGLVAEARREAETTMERCVADLRRRRDEYTRVSTQARLEADKLRSGAVDMKAEAARCLVVARAEAKSCLAVAQAEAQRVVAAAAEEAARVRRQAEADAQQTNEVAGTDTGNGMPSQSNEARQSTVFGGDSTAGQPFEVGTPVPARPTPSGTIERGTNTGPRTTMASKTNPTGRAANPGAPA